MRPGYPGERPPGTEREPASARNGSDGILRVRSLEDSQRFGNAPSPVRNQAGVHSPISAFPVKVLLASSEVHPYSKTGGLADMVGALAKTLARSGHQVGLVTPLYSGIRERFPGLKTFRPAPRLFSRCSAASPAKFSASNPRAPDYLLY